MECERYNRLHPDGEGKLSYVQKVLGNTKGPIVASSDYMRVWAEGIGPKEFKEQRRWFANDVMPAFKNR